MPPTSSTSELYMDQDQAGNPGNFQPPPPSAPTSVPSPTKVEVAQPVVTKTRMADENKDGSIRDTSGEALRPGNDLGFRNVDDETLAAKQAAKQEPKPEEKAPETPVEAPKEATPEPPKAPEKVYAGKYKTVEELEKAYQEAQRTMHEKAEKLAALERARTAEAANPAEAAPKTPEQVRSEQEEATRLLNEFVSNPQKVISEYTQKAAQQTQVALAAQQTAEQWRKDNPDIAEHEIRVAFEATCLAQTDPELAQNPKALLEKATAQFRQFTGKLRTEGAKEALTTETRTVPLLSNTAQPAATEHPAKAPLTADAAYEQHMAMLKEQEQRSRRGLRR